MAKRSRTNTPRTRGWDFFGYPKTPTEEKKWLDNPVAIGAGQAYPYFKQYGDFCRPGYKGWCCTRKKDHSGPHVACGAQDPAYAMWGNLTAREWRIILTGIRLGVPVNI